MKNISSPVLDILWINQGDIIHKDTVIKPHTHETYYHLLYLCTGLANAQYNGVTHLLKPGMMLLAPPGAVHAYNNSGILEPSQYLEIKFVIRSKQLDSALREKSGIFITDECSKQLCQDIIDIGYQQHGNIGLNVLRTYLETLLYHICKKDFFAESDNNQTSFLKGMDINNISKATLATVEYLEKNYMNNISLEQISSSIGYSRNYISTVVKKDLSTSISEALTLIRIRKAAELLTGSDLEIKQILEQTGFKNAQHFTRTFRRIIGVPPAQYRKSFPVDVVVVSNQSASLDVALPVMADRSLQTNSNTKNHIAKREGNE